MGAVKHLFAVMAVMLALSASAAVPIAPFRPLTTEIPRTAVPRPGSLQPQSLPRETVQLCKDPKAFRLEQEAKLREMSKALGAWRKGDPNKTPEEFLKSSGLEKLLKKQQVDPKQIELIKSQLIDAMRLGDKIQQQQQSIVKKGGDK